MTAVGMPHRKNDVGRITGCNHRAPVCNGVGDRLFDKYMLARCCRCQRARQMGGIGGRQDDTVEIVKCEHVLIRGHRFAVEGLRKFCVLLRRARETGPQFELVGFRDHASQNIRPPADSDDTNAHQILSSHFARKGPTISAHSSGWRRYE